MVRMVFVVIGLAVALVGPLIYAGPQLASDLMVGKRWSPALDLSIKESKCTRWYYLVSTCRVDYVSRVDPAEAGGSLKYFVFGSWSGKRALLLRSTDNPGRVGTTLGLEHMRQRMLTLGAFVLLALGVLAAALMRILARTGDRASVAPRHRLPSPPVTGGSFGRRTGPTMR